MLIISFYDHQFCALNVDCMLYFLMVGFILNSTNYLSLWCMTLNKMHHILSSYSFLRSYQVASSLALSVFLIINNVTSWVLTTWRFITGHVVLRHKQVKTHCVFFLETNSQKYKQWNIAQKHWSGGIAKYNFKQSITKRNHISPIRKKCSVYFLSSLPCGVCVANLRIFTLG